MKQLERHRFSLSVTEASQEAGTFRGIASVFNTVIDTWCPTVIDPGAFTATLADEAQVKRVRVLWQHDADEPIGLPTSMVETAAGLDVAAKISPTSCGNDALILMRDGVITDLSIGFDAVQIRMEERPGMEPLRHIVEARLWEFSLVTWGANAPSQIYQVNSLASNKHPWNRINSGIAALRERCAGKVLSAKNAKLVDDAIAALQALKVAAEPDVNAEANRLARIARVEAHRLAILSTQESLMRMVA